MIQRVINGLQQAVCVARDSSFLDLRMQGVLGGNTLWDIVNSQVCDNAWSLKWYALAHAKLM